jgi:hypothetical protein
LIEPLLESEDAETVLRAKEQKVILLYRAKRDNEADAALQDLEQSILDVRRRERAYYEVANGTTYYRPERAIEIADRILATRESRHWVDHALLVKGTALSWIDRYDEAESVFGELASMPPSETVGDGIARMGELWWKLRNDKETARTQFDLVLSASDEFPQIQARCYELYAEMEKSVGNQERVIEICNEGDRNLPLSETSARESLRLIRDQSVTTVQEGVE